VIDNHQGGTSFRVGIRCIHENGNLGFPGAKAVTIP
jgi:hypothetical protein